MNGVESDNSEHSLTGFQQMCEATLRQNLEPLGLKLENREVRWIGEPAIRGEVDRINIWIYVNEAEIGGGDVDCRFERYDYDTPSELINAFVTKVISLVQRCS